ncbi:hypothetical protein [Fodinicurvata sp. EGI_FJ10296]|uniref:hypothetical protein n=1 Tax=Fodinicurvata sp. EGI_FJ10296 TaxID=3231908 RepID=UPI0034541E08
MLGFLGIFGRADDLRRLESAFRAVGLHPRVVPDAVKIAAIRQLRRDPDSDGSVSDADCASAAVLLTYCIIGPGGLAAETDVSTVEAVEERVERAVAAGDSTDARLILLALHAGLVESGVIDRYGLESDSP